MAESTCCMRALRCSAIARSFSRASAAARRAAAASAAVNIGCRMRSMSLLCAGKSKGLKRQQLSNGEKGFWVFVQVPGVQSARRSVKGL